MTLYLIGLGLSTEKDISLRGLDAVKKCSKIYLEDYTSLMSCKVADLEKFYGKKIILAGREKSEQGAEQIVLEAKKLDVAFLIVGDPFSATTHIELLHLAFDNKVKVEVIHNASILNAVGITGLQLYKFGKTASIPFSENVALPVGPFQILKENIAVGAHTLFLLDLNPASGKFLKISEALDILLKVQQSQKEKIINSNTLVVGCARLGSTDYCIKSGSLEKVKIFDFGSAPYCLIIPGKMHFLEEEMLEYWK
ncbi:diphthine synthase [Candidatus Woesearchaeota archaeon]|nr:diphthine synthase [Candidatus Woesearchaeota archaeon]